MPARYSFGVMKLDFDWITFVVALSLAGVEGEPQVIESTRIVSQNASAGVRSYIVSTTNFLLVLIAAMLGIHWFPSVAYPVIVIALIAWALNEFPKWRDRRSREKAVERQLKADEPL